MIKLLLRKSLQGFMMVLIVSAVTFALLGFAGGDALTQLRDNPQISEQTIERLRRVYGLDQPLPVRYFRWLSGAITGDLLYLAGFSVIAMTAATMLFKRTL